MIIGDGTVPHRCRQVSFRNLTASVVPFDCMADGDCRYVVSLGQAKTSLTSGKQSISFWGQMRYRFAARETVDEASRTVFHDGRPILRYPELPSQPVRLEGWPAPLPLARYERWFFDDISRSNSIPVAIHAGQAATRRAFLDNDWNGVSVLHVTTHGYADSASFELSNLMFAQEDD